MSGSRLQAPGIPGPEPVVVHWKCNLTYSIVVWVSSGTARIHLEDQVRELRAGQALWVPPYVAHMVEHDAESLALSIMVTARRGWGLGSEPVLIDVPPSHAQWMFHLMLLTLSPLHSGQVPGKRIVEMLTHFAAHKRSETPPLPLVMPRHPAARQVAARLLSDPGSELRLEDFAAQLSVSERTLRRAFRTDTGLGFRQWRQQAQLGGLDRALPLRTQQVPAFTTRWMHLTRDDLVLWALRGRASVHRLSPGDHTAAESTQALQAGQFLLVPAGQSLRVEIEQGSLLIPLPLPAGSLPADPAHRMPCQLPADYFQTMLHRAISHITLLRPVHFDRVNTLRLLEHVPNFPGLRYPRDPVLRRIAGELTTDVRGKVRAAELAARHGFSLRQLQRRWLAETGLGLRPWRQAHRFQHADALLNSGFAVPFVAAQLGFTEPGNFARAYQKLRGYRPKTATHVLPTDIF
ncbi:MULTISPECIES: helix-turn-helix domain-containing protein [Glutamicibacter]|uniref:AraC-family transcriptional regulator n=1 Tax=Glutamicibacter arilaitensis (strain DSM 16368 / CIP 108037 / IAM 15318 / JCM 13566 / NCIMB 14258 / Re117) TaxID=861360 RepID=A0ABM9PTK8_GLUAR|nr:MULTISPECIES: helix-turn-helix domain-containing protein [Glutamicibacter]CBT74524.1 AraC-family transcriptional regulator [Glutamicibacter arilaitensis Re117]